MSITNFQQTIWSKKIQENLDTITSLKNHCDFEYEPDSKNAKEVKILGVVRPTIRTYVPGTKLTREGGTDKSQILALDQYRYFDFEIEDIDKAQSVPGLIEALTKEGSAALSDEGDKYVGTIVATEAAKASPTIGVLDPTQLSSLTDGGIATIESAFKMLYEKNVRPNSTFYLEINPAWYVILRPEIIKLDTDNSDLIKQGFVGKYGNALISIENLLGTATISSKASTICMLRTGKAVAFCGQIDKVEAFRPEDSFTDAVKALYVFGAKIVRSEEIVAIPVY